MGQSIRDKVFVAKLNKLCLLQELQDTFAYILIKSL